MSEPPSSPPNQHTSPEDAIAYYKRQYEALEAELTDFRISSQELEAELEKDAELAEGKERVWREKAEGLAFEVDEWKTKYKQSKAEANAAQTTLQKEITTLRDTTRTLQLKLRDIEVANDDFERQARNTTSSMEDLESKYNVAIERAVMMEEEIKIGEQEREALRIETQRLREELSDLKIEAEIAHDKLEKATARLLPSLSTHMGTESSPYSRGSPDSMASSPMITTPPDTKSVSTSDTVSETPTPPSPPMSDISRDARKPLKTPMKPPPTRIRMPSGDLSVTPKPKTGPSTARTRDTQRPTINSRSTPSVIRNVVNKAQATRGLPNSTSLTHIRNLTAQMQRLEQRVHSARSKLPAPVNTPPRASPRNGLAYMPPSVTIRSRKRTAGSGVSRSSTSSIVDDHSTSSSRHVSRISTTGISRLSFGPLPGKDGRDSRPTSRTGNNFSGSTSSRPDSRSDMESSYSRTSIGGTRTPIGHFSQSSLTESRRPRSSMGYHQNHRHSQSVNGVDEGHAQDHRHNSTPSRRNTGSRHSDAGSAIPVPRRKSGGPNGSSPVLVRSGPNGGSPVMMRRKTRTISSVDIKTSSSGSMKPPPARPRLPGGLGETF